MTTPIEIRDLKTKVLMQSVVLKALGDIHKADRKVLSEQLAEGERVVALDGDGNKLGTVSKTEPKPVAEVEDMAVVFATLNPDDFTRVIPPRNRDAAMKVISEHAPELFDYEPKEYALAELRDKALAAHKAGEELPAGWAITKKPGVITIRANDAGKAAGQRALEGANLMKEIED